MSLGPSRADYPGRRTSPCQRRTCTSVYRLGSIAARAVSCSTPSTTGQAAAGMFKGVPPCLQRGHIGKPLLGRGHGADLRRIDFRVRVDRDRQRDCQCADDLADRQRRPALDRRKRGPSVTGVATDEPPMARRSTPRRSGQRTAALPTSGRRPSRVDLPDATGGGWRAKPPPGEALPSTGKSPLLLGATQPRSLRRCSRKCRPCRPP